MHMRFIDGRWRDAITKGALGLHAGQYSGNVFREVDQHGYVSATYRCQVAERSIRRGRSVYMPGSAAVTRIQRGPSIWLCIRDDRWQVAATRLQRGHFIYASDGGDACQRFRSIWSSRLQFTGRTVVTA